MRRTTHYLEDDAVLELPCCGQSRMALPPHDVMTKDTRLVTCPAFTKEFFVTFGSNHYLHVGPGLPLRDCFVRVHAVDDNAARYQVVKVFGSSWSFLYDNPEDAGIERYGLLEVGLPMVSM